MTIAQMAVAATTIAISGLVSGMAAYGWYWLLRR